MSVLNELLSIITGVQARGDSGVIMVTGNGDHAAQATTFSLRFEDGQLARAHGGQATGTDALQALAQRSVVSNIRWFPIAAPSASWNGEAVVGNDLLLSFLEAGLAAAQASESLEKQNALAQERERMVTQLVEQTRRVFQNVYVGDTDQTLTEVAKSFSPDTQPQMYLNACAKLLAPMIGLQAAKKLLGA